MKVRVALALLSALVVTGCIGSNVRVNRDWDDPTDAAANLEAQSPEGFVDRLGDPDEWRNEGKGDDVRMTAVWKCVDGQRREVVWRQQVGGTGASHWVVVSDTVHDNPDCKS